MDERLRKIEREAKANPDDPELQDRLWQERLRAGTRSVTTIKGQPKYYQISYNPDGTERSLEIITNLYEHGRNSEEWIPKARNHASLMTQEQFLQWLDDYSEARGVTNKKSMQFAFKELLNIKRPPETISLSEQIDRYLPWSVIDDAVQYELAKQHFRVLRSNQPKIMLPKTTESRDDPGFEF